MYTMRSGYISLFRRYANDVLRRWCCLAFTRRQQQVVVFQPYKVPTSHLEGFSQQSSVPAMDWPALSPNNVNPIAYRNGVPPRYRCWAPSGDPDNGLPCHVLASSPPWNSAVCQVLQLTGGAHARCCACTTGPASQGQVNAEINDKITRVPGVYLSPPPTSLPLSPFHFSKKAFSWK